MCALRVDVIVVGFGTREINFIGRRGETKVTKLNGSQKYKRAMHWEGRKRECAQKKRLYYIIV